jgi:hypothetical protein
MRGKRVGARRLGKAEKKRTAKNNKRHRLEMQGLLRECFRQWGVRGRG